MEQSEMVALIRGGVSEPGGTWADLGAGTGNFSWALAELIGPQGTIYAIDRDAKAIRQLHQRIAQADPGAAIIPQQADLTRPLDMRALDGVLMANALHFIRDQPAALALVAGCAKHATYVQDSAPVAGEKTPYTAPLATAGAKFGALPAVVQNTVRTQVGTTQIYDVRKENHEGHIFYEISFVDSNSWPALLAAPDGSVLNPDLTVAVQAPQPLNPEIKLADLPQEVRKVLQDRPLTAEIVSINQETWGEHTVYVVSFKEDAHRPKMYLIADGTVMIPIAK